MHQYRAETQAEETQLRIQPPLSLHIPSQLNPVNRRSPPMLRKTGPFPQHQQLFVMQKPLILTCKWFNWLETHLLAFRDSEIFLFRTVTSPVNIIRISRLRISKIHITILHYRSDKNYSTQNFMTSFPANLKDGHSGAKQSKKWVSSRWFLILCFNFQHIYDLGFYVLFVS